jgi:hypothetical protein
MKYSEIKEAKVERELGYINNPRAKVWWQVGAGFTPIRALQINGKA